MAGGVAIGKPVCLRGGTAELRRLPVADDAVDAEIARFEQGVRDTLGELAQTRATVEIRLSDELAGVFDAHALILQDPLFVDRIAEVIQHSKVNAEWAVQQVSDELQARFGQIETEYLKERGQDLRDVTRYLLNALSGTQAPDVAPTSGELVVLSDELTPSEILRLTRQGVCGFVVERGGDSSHTVILARALGVPLLIGVENATDVGDTAEVVAIDAQSGVLILEPTADQIESLLERSCEQETSWLEEVERGGGEATTACGAPIELLANVELYDELEDALRLGADGVGLYRSEFMSIERDGVVPSEEDQKARYVQFLEVLGERPFVVRTFDLSVGDLEQASCSEVTIEASGEENPSLGLRGIRLGLARPEFLRSQLRALARSKLEVGATANLQVMAPMVSNLEEIHTLRAMIREVWADLQAAGSHLGEVPDVKLGAMVETPAAVLVCEQLAAELDFLSVGTNDLVQYTLAVDRSNESVAQTYQPNHPAVLKLLERVGRVAVSGECRVTVCGEMAADPASLPLLIGAGFRSFSVTPRLMPGVRKVLARLDSEQCGRLLKDATTRATAREVRALVKEKLDLLVS